MTRRRCDARGGRGERQGRGDEAGAALILALVFVFVIGLILAAVTGMTTDALRNTSNLRQERSVEYAADGAMTAAIQSVRTYYTSAIYSGTPVNCTNTSPITTDGETVYVTCTGTQGIGTRTVSFYACQSVTCDQSSSILAAKVTYGDYLQSAAVPFACNPTSDATCGITETILSWDVVKADN